MIPGMRLILKKPNPNFHPPSSILPWIPTFLQSSTSCGLARPYRVVLWMALCPPLKHGLRPLQSTQRFCLGLPLLVDSSTWGTRSLGPWKALAPPHFQLVIRHKDHALEPAPSGIQDLVPHFSQMRITQRHTRHNSMIQQSVNLLHRVSIGLLAGKALWV